MDDVNEYLNQAVTALEAAADILSDIRCDQWANVGGVGRPPKDKNIGRLYVMAVEVEEIQEAVRYSGD